MKKDLSLTPHTIVRSGKNEYCILSCIRRDGMGYTYIAEPVNKHKGLPNKVVIREHFMPHCSERGTDGITVVTPEEIAPTVENCRSIFEKCSRVRFEISSISPSVISVIDIFNANNTFYYVVEFLDGITFEEYVKQKGPLSWEETRELLSPIFDAVKIMHSRRSIHTEIQPRHIRFVHHKGEYIPVLFSLYASLHFNEEERQMWALPIMTCETGFAPPEQYGNIENFTPQTDIYALAATIVFALSGKKLPDSRVVTEKIIRATLPPALPENTVQALIHALHPDIAQRTASVSAFRDELREFYGGRRREIDDDEHYESVWKEILNQDRIPLAIVGVAIIAALFIFFM